MVKIRRSGSWARYAGYEGLPIPTLPQAQNGVLDVGSAGGAVQVCVPHYTDHRSNDSFIVLLDDAPAPTVPPAHVGFRENITLTVPAWAFSNGRLALRYGVTDATGNGALSPSADIDVSGATDDWLDPPSFPDFVAGVATCQEIARAGGVVVRAPCATLGTGDSITIMWEGYNSVWTPVPEAAQVLLSRQLTAADIAAGYIDAFVKMTHVLPTGDGGHCLARYRVNYLGGRDETARAAISAAMAQPSDGVGAVAGVSRPAQLLLDAAEPFILASATSDAPFRSPDRPYLAPANRVWVATQPFRAITLAVDQGVAFAANDSSVLSLFADASGLASADIYYMNDKGEETRQIACNVTVADDAAVVLPVRVVSRFAGAYLVDQTKYTAYGCRATAIAGVNDFCQIYVVLPFTVVTVNVRASGSALVRGYLSSVKSLTHDDNTCTISLTDEVAETSIITLSGENCDAEITVRFERTPFSG